MDEFGKFYNKALKFLSYRPRSEHEIRDKLTRKKVPQEIIEKIRTTEERIILYDEMVKKTTETLFANEFSYRTGTENFLTLLDTQRELQNFLLMYEKTRIEKEILLAELERELGIPIEKIFQYSQMPSHCFPRILCKGDRH